MNTDSAKKVLIVSKEDLLIDVVSIFLEGAYQATIEVADSSRALEKFFAGDKQKTLDLLLVENAGLLTSAGKSLGDFMAPTILIGCEVSSPQSDYKLGRVKKPLDLKKLWESIRSLTGEVAEGGLEYCRMRPEVLLLVGQQAKQDIYDLKADGTYEVLVQRGGGLDPLRGKKFIYLKRSEFTSFIGDLVTELQNVFQGKEKVFDVASSMEITANVHEIVAQALPELRFTPELQLATKACIDAVVNTIKKDTRLAELLEQLSKNESDYPAWHSTALCYVAARLSSLMTWDSPQTSYKLALAAFLHDITVQSPTLARVSSRRDLALSKASDEEKEAYLQHPHLAAEYARQMTDFPGDVDHIISEHHELPDGQGFPLGMTHTKISPLATVFIIAHEITDELYDKRGQMDLKATAERLKGVYKQGYFRRVLAALSQMIDSEAKL